MAYTYLNIEWSINSIQEWASLWEECFNLNFIVSWLGRLAALYDTCLHSTQERLLAANFGEESNSESNTYLNLVKMIGEIYNSCCIETNCAWG